ncbi:glutathione S-transferase [Conchiformibius kuhniae]|uniref:glutathione transferase n=1 Tax=Conchiformibius kuhniae TaxID=211502 RepID=A0A8T9MU17_9NEIS|nr:glutathione S-transferase [Conchiformibius kuhniae]UOP04584.1 glutathione S-transferase [Conchiformibius kuhniae]
MITLYALEQSRAVRIAWLLEKLKLDYQVERFARNADTLLAPDALRQIHPLGKSPLVRDGDSVLAESGAIAEYLLARYDRDHTLHPAADAPDFDKHLYWLHYTEGSLMPLLVMSLVFRRIGAQKMPFFAKPVARKITDGVRQSFLSPQLNLHLNYVNQALADKTWLLGDTLSGADIMMGFPLQAALSRGGGSWENIEHYVRRMEADADYQRAAERTGCLETL